MFLIPCALWSDTVFMCEDWWYGILAITPLSAAGASPVMNLSARHWFQIFTHEGLCVGGQKESRYSVQLHSTSGFTEQFFKWYSGLHDMI